MKKVKIENQKDSKKLNIQNFEFLSRFFKSKYILILIISIIFVSILILYNNINTKTENQEINFSNHNNQNNKIIQKMPEDINKPDRHKQKSNLNFSSKKYWEERYKKGGNSGSGSYNRLAEFKAKIINKFVLKNNIDSVIEWGCGDGNQLLLSKYKNYVGFDVSKTAIDKCINMFKNDKTKVFIWSGEDNFKTDLKGELSMSLDVIYHLVEDNVFNEYMNQLFNSSNKYVIIYSCNFEQVRATHVRCRKFTDWIDKNISDKWKLLSFIKNDYPYDSKNRDNTSFSDFYIYIKK